MHPDQLQLADMNQDKNHPNSIRFYGNASGIGQQQCYLPGNYYNSNNNEMEQRESLLHSLAQNPEMLNDFYQFLEYTRNRNAAPTNPEEQHIPSLLGNKTSFQHQSSTPKRVRPLNESGESMSSAPKQHKPSTNTPDQRGNVRTTKDQQRKPLPFDQLKRAVSSNLPCFHIDFNATTGEQQLPSAFEARNLVEQHFKDHNIRIQQFSLVGWLNKRLKLGVNNKEDYLKLQTTDNWPKTISNIPIKIVKPKYVPDCFALVVRYVPREMESDFVQEEIKRTIASAENIKQIFYAYERKSNDFRFTVMDLKEYNAARELGRISIGNRWLSVTPFLSGNRMTYCTRCWKVGHMREQCKGSAQRCRVCLEEVTTREEHRCTNIPRCAQCDGDHHSLNGQCNVIRQYRTDLKEDVAKALESGKLHRNEKSNPQQDFSMNNEQFPHLNKPINPRQPAWKNLQPEINSEATTDSTILLLRINENLSGIYESSRRVEEKLEKINLQVSQTTLDTELHQRSMNKLIEHVQSLIQAVLGPVVERVQPELLKSKNGLQSVYDNLRNLKTNLNKDYETRRKCPTTPTPSKDDNPTTTAGRMISGDSTATNQS